MCSCRQACCSVSRSWLPQHNSSAQPCGPSFVCSAGALCRCLPTQVLGSGIYSAGMHAWTVIVEVHARTHRASRLLALAPPQCGGGQMSRLNYGGAICIGVTDADAPFTDERGGCDSPFAGRRREHASPDGAAGRTNIEEPPFGRWSAGFNPYLGALFVTADAYKASSRSSSLLSCRPLPACDAG